MTVLAITQQTNMPSLLKLPRRKHSQYRTVQIIYEFVFKNPNPPHIWDATDRDIENILTRTGEKNDVLTPMTATLLLSIEDKKGMLHKDFIDNQPIKLRVKARERSKDGKPLSKFGKILYFLKGRYWY